MKKILLASAGVMVMSAGSVYAAVSRRRVVQVWGMRVHHPARVGLNARSAMPGTAL